MLAFLVVAALLYLAVSIVSLFASTSGLSANTAPEDSYGALYIGENGDYFYNWDFLDNSTSTSSVDWGMRFIFAGSAVDVDYIKDRLDGDDEDPTISPELERWGSWKSSYMDDGPEQSGSNWDSDRGIKDNPGCVWNFGHMRIYAQSGEDHNYDVWIGNYVIASNHVDQENKYSPWDCDELYRSRETDEQAWRDRITNSLSSAPYNWAIEQSINLYNRSGPNAETVDIGGGTHEYQSDGLGTLISVGQD